MATPTPTQAIVDPSEAYPVDYPWMTPVGAYQCPQEQVKRCCMSLEQTSRMLIDGVGELVPVVNGLSISSQISFHCMFPSICHAISIIYDVEGTKY